MCEKNRLTDEQLEGISGGSVMDTTYTVTLDGVTLTLGDEDTFLEFSKMERTEGAIPTWDGSGTPTEYFDWYYTYYNTPHPWDYR